MSYSQGKLQENYGGSLPFNKFIRELSQGRWRRQRESEKRNRFIKNNNFARVAHFFVHFFAVTARLRLLQDTNERRRIFLSLSKLECGPQEVNSAEIRLRLTFSAKWKKKKSRKSRKKKQKHFKSDVFVAVAVRVVDAKAPPF